MPLYLQPLGLQQLVIEQISTFISDIVVQHVTTANSHSTNPHKTREICEQLQLMIQDIPWNIANALTLEILKHLDNAVPCLKKSTESVAFKDILQEMINSLIHPELTELLISWRWNYISPFVTNKLRSLSKLKLLMYPRSEYQSNKEEMEKNVVLYTSMSITTFVHLETFIFHRICNNEILEILCNNCPNLKCLDVYMSSEVTDACIDSLVKLSNLTELDISETRISEDGQTNLLQGLSERNNKLEHFRSYFMTTGHLNILSNKFPQLREFRGSLVTYETSFDAFKKLTKLEVLCIFNYSPESHLEVLSHVGAHLVKLVLVSYSMNVSSVINYCPSLVSLSIKTKQLVVEDRPHPSLSSLQHLTLRTRNSSAATTLLSQCKNLASLQLCVEQEFFVTNLGTVLTLNNFQCLQKLTVGSMTGNIPPEAVLLMTQHCHNLKTCKVFGGQTEELKTLYKNYHAIKVDPYLWMNLTDNIAYVNEGRETRITRTCLMYIRECRSPYCDIYYDL